MLYINTCIVDNFTKPCSTGSDSCFTVMDLRSPTHLCVLQLGKLIIAEVGLGNIESVTTKDRKRKAPQDGHDSIVVCIECRVSRMLIWFHYGYSQDYYWN